MIHNAIRNAYAKFDTRNYDYLYLALDIHGTCADSDYHNVSSSLYNVAIKPLQVISHLPEVKIILFSCCHPHDFESYFKLFQQNDIKISYFNSNPEIPNTKMGCFDLKFYYDVIFEDKGGFDPSMSPSMFPSVADAFLVHRQFNKRVLQKYGAKQ